MNVVQMLQKLDELYANEEKILRQATALKLKYQQIQEDKEMLQTMIMYASNRNQRWRK